MEVGGRGPEPEEKNRNGGKSGDARGEELKPLPPSCEVCLRWWQPPKTDRLPHGQLRRGLHWSQVPDQNGFQFMLEHIETS
jgi:hypothetical protein